MEESMEKGELVKMDPRQIILTVIGSCLFYFFAEPIIRTILITDESFDRDKFIEERSYLTALPQNPFIGSQEIFRKVNWDCLISFEGSKYSVPFFYAGKSVWIRKVKGRYLKIFSQKNVLIAQHIIANHIHRQYYNVRLLHLVYTPVFSTLP